MFKIQANPTIEANLILEGQGREQTLEVTFKHKTRTDYLELIQSVRDEKIEPAEAVAGLIEKWNADAPPTAASLKLLDDHQPGALWAILNKYGDALVVSRKGN